MYDIACKFRQIEFALAKLGESLGAQNYIRVFLNKIDNIAQTMQEQEDIEDCLSLVLNILDELNKEKELA